MVRDLWPFVVATLIALLATLQPYSDVSPASDLHAEKPGQLNLLAWEPAKHPLLKLDGPWHYYPGQLLTPQRLENIHSGSQTALAQEVKLPHFFSGSELYSPAAPSFGSYHLNLTLENQQALSLSLPKVCNSARVFFYPQGQAGKAAVYEVGKPSHESAKQTASLASLNLPLVLSGSQQHYELLIQIAGFSTSNPGLCQTPIIGKLSDISQRQSFQGVHRGIVIAIILCFGLYSIGTFIAGSRNRSYIWLGSTALLIAATHWGLENVFATGFGFDENTSFRIACSLLYGISTLSGALIVGYIHHSFKVHFVSNRLININLVFAIILSLPFIVLPIEHIRPFLIGIAIYGALQYGFILYLLRQVTRNRLLYSRRILFYLAPLLLALLLRLGEYLGFFPHSNMLLASLVFLTVAQGLTQSQKLARASQVAARLSRGLSDAVQQRTSALNLKNLELLQAQKELKRANRELQALSVTDGLTGVYNRMHFDRQFVTEWQRSRREQQSICLLLLDIDHFKNLNDQYGHTAGDEALRSIAHLITEKFKRGGDFVCRYGGEEFIVILSNTNSQHAFTLAEDLRKQAAEQTIHYENQKLELTVSIGVCGLTPEPEHQPLDLLNAADQALYLAKRSGRNQVQLADAPSPNRNK